MKKYLAMLAVVLMGWSCAKYDDTALKGRIDGLEDRVSKLESQLKTLNDGYEAIQKLIGDGFVTGFEEGTDSYTITVKSADGTSKKYTLKKAEKGDKGDKGDTPAFTLAGPDGDGRYWWQIDGEDAKDSKGDLVYASGIQGETGEDGATPHLAVAAEKDGQPDFTNDDPKAELHWWVSYDWNDDDAAATWEDLGIAKGQADDVVITATYEDGMLTIFVNGEKQVSVEIGTEAATPIIISLSIDGEPIEEYSTVSFAKGETVTIAVVAEGTSENAIVKAELLNPGYGYSLYVNGSDLELTATGAGDCEANKLLIEVIDCGVSHYTWLGLETVTVNSASIRIAEVDENDYMPVAFGSGYSNSINRYAVKPTITLALDSPAEEDMTFNVSYEDLDDATPGLAALVKNIPGTVTIKQGEQSVLIPCEIPSREKLECDMGILISAESENATIEANLYVANNFSIKLPLTAANFECPFDAVSSEEGNGIAALCDGDPDTFLGTYYWPVDAFKEHANSINVYGVFVDINLPSGVAEIQFKYQNRNGENGQPRGLKFGYYMYGSWMNLAGYEKNSGFNGDFSAWNESAVIPVNGGACNKFRFGVTKSITDQKENNLCFNPEGSMTLAELEVWAKY